MKISKYKVGSRRFITLVDDFEIPVNPLANAYLYESNRFLSLSTLERAAWELKFVLDYFESVGICLEQRTETCQFLSMAEMSGFYFAARVKKSTLKNLKKIAIIPSVESKALRNSISHSIMRESKVSPSTCSGRVKRLREYIEFIFYHYFEEHAPSEDKLSQYHSMIRKLKMTEFTNQNSVASRTLTLDESVIPSEVFSELLQIIKPENDSNPFRSSKLRNYLIISILIQTGIRRSEVCKLKISDCQFYGDARRLKIYSTKNDPDDPRLNRPNKKVGRPHISGVDANVMKDLMFYIKNIRSKYSKSGTHDFIFIAEQNSQATSGLPITRELVNYILKRVSISLKYDLHPHLLRHKWNERLSEMGSSKGVDRERLEDMRRNAMGWSPRSNMGDIYNTKYEQIRAIELMSKHQEKVDGKTSQS